jgi:hypothetical protein
MRHTGNRIGGSNPSLSARTSFRQHSLSYAALHNNPLFLRITVLFLIWTHSLSFAIMRADIIVGTIEGFQPEDRGCKACHG